MSPVALHPVEWPCVLIVDDDAAFRSECSEALAHFGVVSWGSSGLPDWAQTKGISAVILDLSLSEGSGYDVLDGLAIACPHARILVASGRGADLLRSAVAYARDVGFRDVQQMAKPLSAERLGEWAQQCTVLPDDRTAHPDDALGLSPHDAIRTFRDGGLCPHYQGQYRLDNGRIIGVEALARLRLANGTVAAPAAFLHHLIDADLGRELFTAMLEASLGLLKRVEHLVDREFRVALNLSEDLLGPHQEWLIRLLSAPHIPPQRLTLELPETATTTAIRRWNGLVSRLRLLGYGVSLDDFGREASNLDRLVTLPITEVKIDRMFVEQVRDGMVDPGVLASVNRMCRALSLTSVVEGVSSQPVLDLCRSLGFDLGQGYHLSRPLAEPALLEHLFELHSPRVEVTMSG